MSRTRSAVLTAALLVTALLAAGCGVSSRDSADKVQGVQQLNFTAQTLDGQKFAGKSLLGKPAVLWFWAPWCPKCAQEAPGVARVSKQNQNAVRFVGVPAQDSVPAMKRFVQQHELGSFDQLADTDASLWRRFGVTAQPAFAFVRPDGQVAVVKEELSEAQLRERVQQLIAR